MSYSVERSSSGQSSKEFSLREIRMLCLKGVMPWHVYQHFESALSTQFSEYRHERLTPLAEVRTEK